MNKKKKVYLSIIIVEISIMLFAYGAYFIFFYNNSALNTPVSTNDMSIIPISSMTSSPSEIPSLTKHSEPDEHVNYVKTTYKQKKYLYKNPIVVTDVQMSDTKGLAKIDMGYPQINGLKDKTIESKINKDIQNFYENLTNDLPALPQKNVSINAYYSLDANYNNVISFQIFYTVFPEGLYNSENTKDINDYYSYMHSKQFGLVFDLTSGKRLSLKDSFVTGSDYKTPLNKEISKEIFKASLDEDEMKRPFKGIEESTSFYIHPNEIIILFPSESSVFGPSLRSPYGLEKKEFAQFRIPFYKLEGTVDIFDKYNKSSDNIYEDKYKDKFLLENDFDIKLSAPEFKIGNIQLSVRSFSIEGLTDVKIQEKINADVKKNIAEMTDEEGLKKLNVPDDNYYKSINAYCIGNVPGYLCINYQCRSNIPGSKESASKSKIFSESCNKYTIYDIKSGKIIRIDDIFTDKTKGIHIMNDAIKRMLAENHYNSDGFKGYETVADKIQAGFDSVSLHISLEDIDIGGEKVNCDSSVRYDYLDKESIVFFK